MGGVFAAIGTPAVPPKPRGKSQGWTPGKRRSRKNRYPTVKKTAAKPRKEQQKSALSQTSSFLKVMFSKLTTAGSFLAA
ncbi:hypothetical protein VB735_08090 [Halotia wernerae UHCC 0503]|nr:hypothetical protein [Halotia wernerae UHCC 0503]